MSHTPGREEPAQIPIRMLCEHVYCPRLAYLEWVQGEFQDNEHVMEGRFKHRNVDKPSSTVQEDEEGKPVPFHQRSIMLGSEEEQILGVLDLLENDNGEMVPVEYKKGNPDSDGMIWPADRVQVEAQMLLLRANGYSCEHGIVYYFGSNRRIELAWEEDSAVRVREAVSGIRANAQSETPPKPLKDSRKCDGCSLVDLCLPDEVNLLIGEATTQEEGEPPVRRLIAPRLDGENLYVATQGAVVTKRGDTLLVHCGGNKLGSARLPQLEQVCLMGNVQLSTQVVKTLLARDIPLLWFTTGGWFQGMTAGLGHKNIQTRQLQFRLAADPQVCLEVARSFVTSKIRNCRTLARRNLAEPEEEPLRRLANSISDASKAESLEQLLGIEGNAAKTYFRLLDHCLRPPSSKEGGGETAAASAMTFDLNGRNRRPPKDPVNAMLSYGYSILAKECQLACLTAGFDPLLGFYHQPRYGRPALALDLMESFRPLVVDSTVLRTVNTGEIRLGHFYRSKAGASFTKAGKKVFLLALERRFDELVTHPLFQYRVSYRRILHLQARLLVRFLSGELPSSDGPPEFCTR